MNFLKNLLILAVLAAVGYGIYVSLTRNNVDPGQPPGVAEGWPAVPKVELPANHRRRRAVRWRWAELPCGPLRAPVRASAKRRRRLCLRRRQIPSEIR